MSRVKSAKVALSPSTERVMQQLFSAMGGVLGVMRQLTWEGISQEHGTTGQGVATYLRNTLPRWFVLPEKG